MSFLFLEYPELQRKHYQRETSVIVKLDTRKMLKNRRHKNFKTRLNDTSNQLLDSEKVFVFEFVCPGGAEKSYQT